MGACCGCVLSPSSLPNAIQLQSPARDYQAEFDRLRKSDPNFAALSTKLKPTLPEEKYLLQADLYFSSLESKATKSEKVDYSDLVLRWEWPPWLLLTGFGKKAIIAYDDIINTVSCKVVDREHRFFPENPFVRSVVTFYYGANNVANNTDPIHIYEEFTFNDAGQITFIEAWTPVQGKYLPKVGSDRWPEGKFFRMSTVIPGLGNSKGMPETHGPELAAAAKKDPRIKDFQDKANNFAKELVETIAQRKKEWIVKNLKKLVN